MKKNFFSGVLLVSSLLFSLTAFMAPNGGEGYEIYLDNKLVIRQFGEAMKQVNNLKFNQSQKRSELSVKFFHCGMAGKSRLLQLKTPAGEVLKQWAFANDEARNFSISVPVKEILDLEKKAGGGTLHLYYASKETPGGRFLAGISLAEPKSTQGK